MPEQTANVGTIVTLKRDLLGNMPGAIGICFYNYDSGSQFIFENGEYDGFSLDEQDKYLTVVGQDHSTEQYEFKNVIKVLADFNSNTWFHPAYHERNEWMLRRKTIKHIEVVDVADLVLCDDCGKDYTDSLEEGGLLFQSKAICPRCAPKWEANIKLFSEEEFVRSRARHGQTFKDFALEARHGNNRVVTIEYE